jgi:hypothetical protein
MKTGFFQSSLSMAAVAGASLLFSLGCSTQKSNAQAESSSVSLTSSVTTSTAPDSPDAAVSVAQAEIPTDLSPGVAEIAKLAQAHVAEEVMMAYASNHPEVHPTADEVVYLTDLGVSDKVVTTLLGNAGTASASTSTVEPSAPAQETQTAVQSTAAEPSVEPPAPAETAVQTTAPAPVTVEYLHDSLTPYGAWIDVPGYGVCWQPTVVVGNPEWRPYGDRGHWVYTDCGWYWESDYTWGWAPFHYGRWFLAGPRGWVWRPDTVWGPSWVCWRHTDAYYGWAPLPPAAGFEVGVGLTFNHGVVAAGFDFGLGIGDFMFVGTSHFYDRRPWQYRVPLHEMPNIYGRSVVINTIVARNHLVVNVGPSHDHIAAAIHRPLTPIAIRNYGIARSPGQPARMDHFSNGGRTLNVYHPHFEPGHTPAAGHVNQPVTINRGSVVGRPGSGRGPSAVSTPRSASPAPSRNVNVGSRPSSGNTFNQPASRTTVQEPRSAPSGNGNRPNTTPSQSPASASKQSPSARSVSPRQTTPSVTANPSVHTPARSSARGETPSAARTRSTFTQPAQTRSTPTVTIPSSRPQSAQPSVSAPASRPAQNASQPASQPAPASRGSSHQRDDREH